MMKSNSPPTGALCLTTYEELRQYARGFKAGHLRFCIIVGPAGVGKSQVWRRTLVGSNAFWFDGNATPFGIYCAAFENLNRPLILDDLDGLSNDRKGVRLLKALCQSDSVKRLSWESDAATLERRGIPRHFETSSPVALICNAWANVNADVLAVEDRAHSVYFDPSPVEVHSQARKWFTDQEIYDFVGSRLHLIEQHSFRTYVLALELKSADMDWRRSILGRCLTGPALKVARLQYDSACPTAAAKVAAFKAAGFGGRSTYFNNLKKIQPQLAVPSRPLLNPKVDENDDGMLTRRWRSRRNIMREPC
jgi:hypothetical protein